MEGEIKYKFIENEDFVVFDDGRVFKRLDPPVSSSGYKFVRIGEKSYPLHRVIASTFIPNPENKPQVNHIDGNKTNNAVSNLEWVTNSENMQHAIEHGLFRKPKKLIRGKTKTSKMKIFRVELGLSQREVASALGVNASSISLWETGKAAPTVKHLIRLADILGCKPGDLFE